MRNSEPVPHLCPRLHQAPLPLPLQKHINDAMLKPDQMDAMPSQREGQLDDDAYYQTAYQSARTVAVPGELGGPVASLSAPPQHRPTVDGMEEVRGSSPLSSTHYFPWSSTKRIGVISALYLVLIERGGQIGGLADLIVRLEEVIHRLRAAS